MYKKAVANIVVVLIVLVALLFFFNFAGLGAIILQGDDSTFYSYHGTVPTFKQILANGRQACVPDKPFRDAVIEYTGSESEGFRFPDNQVIILDGIKYEFVTSDVYQAESKTSTCGAPHYKTEIFKDGEKIDSVTFPAKVEECSDLIGITRVVREYGNIKATFGYRWERAGDTQFCRGKQFYVIHRFDIIPAEETAETDETTTPEQTITPDEIKTENKEMPEEITVTPKNVKAVQTGNFFTNFINSIINFFKGIFT